MHQGPRRGTSTRQRGFSLIEQVVAVGLIGIVVPALIAALSILIRGTSKSDTDVTMLSLARSQIESVKEQSFQALPAAYAVINPVPDGFSVTIAVTAVKTYTYPEPDPTATLPDEIQLITVEVSCPDCSPSANPLTLEDYKVRR